MREKPIQIYLIFWCLPFFAIACNPSERTSPIPAQTLIPLSDTVTITQLNTPERLESKTTFSKITSTPTPPSTAFGSNELILTLDKGGSGSFALAPDGSIWVHGSIEPGSDELWHYDNGKLVDKIHLFSPGKLDGIKDFKVTDKEIWILDHAGWRPSEHIKVVRLGLDGTILASYLIPTRILFGPDGEYYESGVDEIIIDQMGNVILNTVSGLYRFFDSQGEVNLVRLEGYILDGEIYKINDHGTDSLPCVIQAGKKLVEVDFENSWCQEIIGFGSDGSFYVLLGNLIERKNSVLHVSAAGEKIGMADVLFGINANYLPIFPSDYEVDPNGKVYAVIYINTDRSFYILRLNFSPELPQTTNETLSTP